MKARLLLVREDEPHPRVEIYDWQDVVDTNEGKVQIQHISLYDHVIFLDEKEYRIAHMLSKESF